MTRLCVPIFVDDLEQARRDVALAAEAGADLVELRIDGFGGDVSSLLEHPVVPVILTCRAPSEGGRATATDPVRMDRLATLSDRAAYVDVELASLATPGFSHERLGSRLIVSAHDFQGRPDRLYNILTELNAGPGKVNKIVWTARTVRDNLEAFEILQSRQKPTIALCMGEAGAISRVLARKFGAFLTFASLNQRGSTAPGQISIADMKGLYRWDALGARTRVFGVVGSPISHSMSPAIHNASFDEIGFDGVYLPLLVNPGYESFKAFMESFLALESLDLSGLSITIPHKENALRFLLEKGVEVEELARQIGAVNTIAIRRPNPDGVTLSGINTDYAAILDSITAAMGVQREDLSNYRVAVIGAGGTGRTAVAALAHYGATVVIYNRTRERAEALAAEFNGRRGKVVAAAMEKLCDSCCHIFMNTTSVGMHPNVDASPLGDKRPEFNADTLVFDSIYNPMQTRLLAEAQAAGAKTVSGVEMFVRQAAAQFEFWTSHAAPMQVMRKVVESRLDPSVSHA